jgi:hypothetical protein
MFEEDKGVQRKADTGHIDRTFINIEDPKKREKERER